MREVLQRALGLRAPVAVGGDLDRAEGVGLGARRRHAVRPCSAVAPRFNMRIGSAKCDRLGCHPGRKSGLPDFRFNVANSRIREFACRRREPRSGLALSRGRIRIAPAPRARDDSRMVMTGVRYFLRNLSRLTISAPAPPRGGDRGWRRRRVFAHGPIGHARFQSGPGQAPARRRRGGLFGARAASGFGSNCRPNCTEGSKKPLIASNGTVQLLRDAVEGQADLEGVLGDAAGPRTGAAGRSSSPPDIAARSAADRRTPRRAGVERDEEMMLARQAGLGDLGQHLADDAAQRVLGQEIVADEVSAMRRRSARRRDCAAC